MASKLNIRVLKKMGFLADQEGIINRYLREQGGWDTHLHKCREYILRKVKEFEGKRVTILGSGWLLDVPLEELSGLCEELKLVDVFHPPQIRRKIKVFGNVDLISDDITGGLIEKLWKQTKRKPFSLADIEVPDYQFDFDPGLVISLNILTQTDTLLNDFLVKRADLSIEEHRRFRAKVQQAHLNLLSRHPHLLITDYSEEILDIDDNTILETKPLIFASEAPAGKEKEEWSWIFDSSGEYYRRKRVIFKVMAIDNLDK